MKKRKTGFKKYLPLLLLLTLCVGAVFPVYWSLVQSKSVLKVRGDISAIALKEMSGDPTTIPDYGVLYSKDDTTLNYIDGAGNSYDLTAGGGGGGEWTVAGGVLANTVSSVTSIDLEISGTPVASVTSTALDVKDLYVKYGDNTDKDLTLTMLDLGVADIPTTFTISNYHYNYFLPIDVQLSFGGSAGLFLNSGVYIDSTATGAVPGVEVVQKSTNPAFKATVGSGINTGTVGLVDINNSNNDGRALNIYGANGTAATASLVSIVQANATFDEHMVTLSNASGTDALNVADGTVTLAEHLFLAEIATPTARTNYGAIYTKSDDKLYFQDGAGSEHEVAFSGGSAGEWTVVSGVLANTVTSASSINLELYGSPVVTIASGEFDTTTYRLRSGSAADATTLVQGHIAKNDTGKSISQNIGLLGEAGADSSYPGSGIAGISKTFGAQQARSVYGHAYVNNGTDSASAIAGYFASWDTHTGGDNVAVYAWANNGSDDFSFYGFGGQLFNEDEVITDSQFFVLEGATPTARTDYGAIYTKSDNKLYFQDGDGTEHEVAFTP